jgi:hypothetical protein
MYGGSFRKRRQCCDVVLKMVYNSCRSCQVQRKQGKPAKKHARRDKIRAPTGTPPKMSTADRSALFTAPSLSPRIQVNSTHTTDYLVRPDIQYASNNNPLAALRVRLHASGRIPVTDTRDLPRRQASPPLPCHRCPRAGLQVAMRQPSLLLQPHCSIIPRAIS